MNIISWLKGLWNFFNGKKTYIGMVFLFVYGGLSFVGVEVELLKQIGIWLGAVGLGHAGTKMFNKHV